MTRILVEPGREKDWYYQRSGVNLPEGYWFGFPIFTPIGKVRKGTSPVGTHLPLVGRRSAGSYCENAIRPCNTLLI